MSVFSPHLHLLSSTLTTGPQPDLHIIGNEGLLHDLQPYAGTDATDILKTENAPDALHQLLQQDDLVIAKLTDGTRRQILAEELHKHNHIPTEDDRSKAPPDRHASWRVWVCIDTSDTSRNHQTVFDVTRMCSTRQVLLVFLFHGVSANKRTAVMIMFGGAKLEKTLRPFLGRHCKDVEVAKLLRAKYRGFIVGELTQGWRRGAEGEGRRRRD